MRRISFLVLAVWLDAAAVVAAGDAERGRIVFALAGGCGCHTPDGGPVGAGGREIATPFGTFYGTNITPDPQTGLGRWSDDEIAGAIRDGDAHGKGVEAPVMPYYLYSGMSDEDTRDLVAYLRSLPAIHREVPEPDVRIPFPRLAYRAWRVLFAPSVEAPARAPAEEVARGRYWVNHVSICVDCHTPRDRFGALQRDLELAGADQGPDGKPVPNITPDRETGIGDWDESDIVQLLSTGMLPNFDNVQALMAEVVDGRGGGPGYKDAPEVELRAIARYLKTVPAVQHEVGEKE